MFDSFSFPPSVDEQSQTVRQHVDDECDRPELVAPHTRLNGNSAPLAMSDADAACSVAALSQSLNRQTLNHQFRQAPCISNRPGFVRKPPIQRSHPQDYADIVRQSRQSYTQLHCRQKHLAKVASVVERMLAEGTSFYDVASDSRRSSSDVSDSNLPTPDENYANRNMMDLSAASSESKYPTSSYATITSAYQPLELSYRKTSFQRERAGNEVEKKIRMRKRKVVGGQGARHAG